jgi:protein-disulfide isomerase
VDKARFERCLDQNESKALVEADIAEGNALGVQGTPSLYINGRRPRSYEFREVKAVLDEMLPAKR